MIPRDERVRRAAEAMQQKGWTAVVPTVLAELTLDASGYPADLERAEAENEKLRDTVASLQDEVMWARADVERALDALRALINAKTDEEYDEQYTAALAVLADLTAETGKTT